MDVTSAIKTKPRLYKREGYWCCECACGVIGINADMAAAYRIWAKQAGAECK